MRVEVGVRELRENLAEWLDRAAAGEEILVTERGKPKAVLSAAESAWDRMVREGRITPARGNPKPLPPRSRCEDEGRPSATTYGGRGEGAVAGAGPRARNRARKRA